MAAGFEEKLALLDGAGRIHQHESAGLELQRGRGVKHSIRLDADYEEDGDMAGLTNYQSILQKRPEGKIKRSDFEFRAVPLGGPVVGIMIGRVVELRNLQIELEIVVAGVCRPSPFVSRRRTIFGFDSIIN